MERTHVGLMAQPNHQREIFWKLYFRKAYDTSDQKALLMESIVKFLTTPVGWQLLSAHLRLSSSEVAVSLDLTALTDRSQCSELSDSLHEQPEDCLKCLQAASHEALSGVHRAKVQQLLGRTMPHCALSLHVFNHQTSLSTIAAIKASCIGRLITVRGIVTRASAIRRLILGMEFACTRCGCCQRCSFPDGAAARPGACSEGCRSRSFTPVLDSADTVAWQRIRLQDLRPLGSAVEAERMSTVEVELHGSLAGSCIPGDTVTCVGLVKVLKTETATGGVGDGKKSLFLLYLEANSISLGADITQFVAPDARARAACCGSLTGKPSLVPGFSTKDLQFVIKFHEEFQGRQFAHLVHFLCPAVPGNGLVKAGLVLAVLGGVAKPDGASSFRGALHILLCGSAGTPQNELLQAVALVSPQSQTIDGSSPGAAGGLLGAVKKESVTGDHLVEAGPLTVATHGVCCIQHLEKLTVHHTALQEAMQTGHLAVSKHGLSACLPARTGIVAVASPIGGHLAAVKTLQENAKLPPSLLASFDLIYELKDQQNVHIDAGGRHEESACESEPGVRLPLEQQLQACASAAANPVPVQLLRKYIAYAQTYVAPVLSAGAKEALQSFHLQARREGSNTVAGVAPNLQLLETLIRLAEARARADLRQVVTCADAEDAIELVQLSLFAGSPEEAAVRDFRPAGSRRTGKQSEAKRFLAALEKRCQLAGSSEVSVAQMHVLGTKINLSVPDMDAFIEQLNDAGVILKKGRSMYEVPSAKSNLVPLAGVQQSQSRSGCSAQPADNSQFYTRSVAKPMTPSYAEAH